MKNRNELPGRLALIDGMRGIAASAVVLYHFNGRLNVPALYGGWIFEYGNLGVALFFVLSGFVITMSIGDRLVSANFLWRFALRRSIRLDPPYWCSIAAILLVGYVGARFGVHAVTPNVGSLLAHMTYTQDLLGITPISPIYWSLCLEIQFYLFVVLLLWALQGQETPAQRVGKLWYQSILLLTILVSGLCRDFSISTNSFVPFWFCFALGANAYWLHAGWIKGRFLIAAVLIVTVNGLLTRDAWSIATAASTSLICVASRAHKMNLLNSAVPQFLGRISYSLYLTHVLFGWYALSIAMRFFPNWIAALIGSAICIVSAWIWYFLIERTSIALSHRILVKSRQNLNLKSTAVSESEPAT